MSAVESKIQKVIGLAEDLCLSGKEYMQLAEVCKKKATEPALIKYALTFEAEAFPKDEEEGLRLDQYFDARAEINDLELWVDYIRAAMRDAAEEVGFESGIKVPVRNIRLFLEEMRDPREIKGIIAWESWDILDKHIIDAIQWRIEDRMSRYAFQDQMWNLYITPKVLLKKD